MQKKQMREGEQLSNITSGHVVAAIKAGAENLHWLAPAETYETIFFKV